MATTWSVLLVEGRDTSSHPNQGLLPAKLTKWCPFKVSCTLNGVFSKTKAFLWSFKFSLDVSHRDTSSRPNFCLLPAKLTEWWSFKVFLGTLNSVFS